MSEWIEVAKALGAAAGGFLAAMLAMLRYPPKKNGWGKDFAALQVELKAMSDEQKETVAIFKQQTEILRELKEGNVKLQETNQNVFNLLTRMDERDKERGRGDRR